MAPNGTTSRKSMPALASYAAKHSTNNDTAPAAPQKAGASKPNGTAPSPLFEDLQKTPKIKSEVVTALPVVKKPGNWDDEVLANGVKKEATPPRQSVLRRPPPDLVRAFPNGKPMSDTPIVLKCNHCKRTVTETGMPKHIERCLNKKQEKSRKKKEAKEARDAAARKERGGGDSDEDEDGEKSAVKGDQAGKKRKATADDDDMAAPASKKKKLKLDAGPKSKPSKLKAPVDVEKQCGVELPQGGQCARSLTCKSHSMGAKRAVPGRSARYDKLLLEYQRKNQAKQQRAVMDANAPDPDDDILPLGPVDEEQEKEEFMAGIARAWGGAPLWQPSYVSQRRKYENVRLKGMLAAALGGRNGNLFAVPGAATQAAPAVRPGPIVDADGIVHPRRPSVVPGARSMMAPATSRKASVASVGASTLAPLWKPQGDDNIAPITSANLSPSPAASSPLTSFYSMSPERLRSATPVPHRAQAAHPPTGPVPSREHGASNPALLCSAFEERRINGAAINREDEAVAKAKRIEA